MPKFPPSLFPRQFQKLSGKLRQKPSGGERASDLMLFSILDDEFSSIYSLIGELSIPLISMKSWGEKFPQI
jgi:hypothetical protein